MMSRRINPTSELRPTTANDHVLRGGGKRRWRPSGSIQLAMIVCLLLFVWLMVLPWMATRPGMAAHLDWLEERGIDPSAMYYTELDAMEEILDRIEKRRK